MPKSSVSRKPALSIPTMKQIAALPWNGYDLVSTFSGCGGSCLGFKMAGFRVLWASEFVPAAQLSYRANHPTTLLDTRDIRSVTAAEILKAIDRGVGEIDVLEGSPPCASFSTAGVLNHGWGKSRSYSETEQRVDDLFFEFVRLLRELQPKCFVAENVSGLVRGVAKGYFLEILDALKRCGYDVKCRLLDAQWLGVPQMRERLIFIGTRNDLAIAPQHPTPFSYRYAVGEVLPAIRKIEEDVGFRGHPYKSVRSLPAPTFSTKPVKVDDGNGPRRIEIAELKRLCTFPEDFILTGTYAQQWERLGRAVPPLMMRAVALVVRDRLLGAIHEHSADRSHPAQRQVELR